MMHIGWPQGILIIMLAVRLAFSIDMKRNGPHEDFRFTGRAINTGIIMGLLWWGGFFA